MFSILLVLVVVGVALWAVNTYVPMDAKIRAIMNVVVVVLVVVWLLGSLGLVAGLPVLR